MNLQIIKGMDGKEEYVLLPVQVFKALQEQIEDELIGLGIEAGQQEEYDPFDPADYVQNPIALARMKAGIKQIDLANRMGVSQAYISKLEHAEVVSDNNLNRVRKALKKATL